MFRVSGLKHARAEARAPRNIAGASAFLTNDPARHSLTIEEPQPSEVDERKAEPSLFTPDGHIRSLAEIREEVIRIAMLRYGGRKSEIARHLQIGRSTLYRELENASARNIDTRQAPAAPLLPLIDDAELDLTDR